MEKIFQATGLLLVLLTYVNANGFSRAPLEATARINLKGVVGFIKFKTLNESAIQITTNFTGLPINGGSIRGLNWHVHRFPVDLTINPDHRCLNIYVGGHYDPFMARANENYTMNCSPGNPFACEIGDLTGKFGQLQNGYFVHVDNTGLLQLGGLRGIVGRSIVVHDSNGINFVCGTIRSNIEEQQNVKVITLSATFLSPLAGTIYLRQAADEHVVMFGKLFWVNGSPTTMSHSWHIHEMAPSVNYRNGRCSDIGPHFDPFLRPPPNDSSYFCSPDPSNITNCEVGDLTGKHDTVAIAAAPLPFQEFAFFYTDIFLNLTGVRAVNERSIAIHAPNRTAPIVACAPLVRTEERRAIQFPDGYFQASQSSPYEETKIRTSTSPSLNISLLSEVFNTYNLCPVNRPLYNPFPSDKVYPIATPDTQAVGSIFQKYPLELRGNLQPYVTELPVYGINTITARTLQIVTENCRICSAIPAYYNVNTTIVAVASFNSTIRGNIIFIQEKLSNISLGKTNIIVDLHYSNSSHPSTSAHNWHIHRLPPSLGQPCEGTIGPHFNPFNVSLNSDNSISNYSKACSPSSPLRCESGDMSGKHGQLRIDPPGPNMITYSYLDPSLYLYGPDSHTIIGRSVGIHEPIPGGPVQFCAKVQRAYFTSVDITITEPTNYNRVDFVQTLANMAQVSPQSIVLQHVDVRTSNERNCAQMTLSALGETETQSINMASSVQSTLCSQYRDDPCLTSRMDFDTLCNTISSATMRSLSIPLALLILVAVSAWMLNFQ